VAGQMLTNNETLQTKVLGGRGRSEWQQSAVHASSDAMQHPYDGLTAAMRRCCDEKQAPACYRGMVIGASQPNSDVCTKRGDFLAASAKGFAGIQSSGQIKCQLRR